MNNFFTFAPADISAAVIIFNLIIVSFISIFISWIYQKTHNSLSYSQSFSITLILIAPVSMIIIMIVQNNIYGALGLLGAFSLIRFRTIVKETKDISFLFFSLVEGVAIGSGHYTVAVISTVFIAALIVLLFKFKFGSVSDNKHILMLVSSEILSESKLKSLAERFKVRLRLLNMRKMGKSYEYTYSFQAEDTDQLQNYLTVLDKEFSLKSYDLISGRDTVEY